MLRVRIRVSVRFLLFCFKLADVDPWCNTLRNFTWTEKIWGGKNNILKNNIFLKIIFHFTNFTNKWEVLQLIQKCPTIFLGWSWGKIFSDRYILPLAWLKYTDDIFMLWQHGEKEFKKFFEILNSSHHQVHWKLFKGEDKFFRCWNYLTNKEKKRKVNELEP